MKLRASGIYHKNYGLPTGHDKIGGVGYWPEVAVLRKFSAARAQPVQAGHHRYRLAGGVRFRHVEGIGTGKTVVQEGAVYDALGLDLPEG